MKNLLFLLVIVASVTLSSFRYATPIRNNKNSETNYILYYSKVNEAKALYDAKKYTECFTILDNLFRKYEPIETLFIYEMDLYCKLAYDLKKYSAIKQVVPIMIKKYGRQPYDYEHYASIYDDYGAGWKDIIAHSSYTEAELKAMYNEHLSKVNYTLKDTIVEMVKRDQLVRRENIPSKLDSVNKAHGKILQHIVTKYGYPTETLVGSMKLENPVKPAYLSAMLKHMDYELCLILQPLLYEEVKKGKCPPFIYAGMLDHLKVVRKMQTPFPYYGTYNTNVPLDLSGVDAARLSIGLPPLKKEK
nr:hypothetical protein [uncultured Flavobacterium sp.]